ncbi:MAG: prepilin-type N-terminal cleavage/methylation domain-containing protein [Vicinamibacterales bacterium]
MTRPDSILRGRADDGFTLLELLAAMALASLVTAASVATLHHAVAAARVSPALADAQQRARVAADAVAADLRLAGAGLAAGPATGSLAAVLPPVLPRRLGPAVDDETTARGDVVTILYVPSGAPQARLADPFGAGATRLRLTTPPNCATGRDMCGFRPSDVALAFDATGRFGLFEILDVSPAEAGTRPLTASGAATFAAGESVAAVEVRGYYFDRAARQLRAFDGRGLDSPVVDHVVDFALEYFGDPEPPRAPRPPAGTANCLFLADGTPAPGLDRLDGAGARTLVALSLDQFRDGPWCGGDGIRFDADLLRVRAIALHVRVEAAADSLRGADARFGVPGSSRSALQAAPDVSIRTSVAPPNLQVIR